MSRNLEPETIRRFKGIDAWNSFANSTPDRALDCLNVIPATSGAVEKMRVPIALTPFIGAAPLRLRQYENGNTGLRQTVAQFGASLYGFDANWNKTLINTNTQNALALFDFVENNNLFFGMNGTVAFKWDGTSFTKWGIAAPAAAPTVNVAPAQGATPININAAAGTVNIAGGSGRTSNLVTLFTSTPHGLSPGNLILVAGCTPSDFNGFFIVQDTPTASALDYIQAAPDENISGFGTLQSANASGVFRYNNEVTVTLASNHGLQTGQQVVIAGVADTSFNGTFQLDSIPSANQFTYPQNGVTAISGGGTETPANAPIFSNGGRRYRISYGNLTTLHVSSASAISASTGNVNGTLKVTVKGPASTDSQVNTAILWSTLDGGSDYYFNQQINIAALTAPVFQDTLVDSMINTALLAPLINNPPPLGKFVSKWQGRTVIFDLNTNAQGFAYSGYEYILVGRPEESFPPNNLLRLQLGTDELRGGGAVANGFVIFSRSQREKQDSMYILQGQLQDITIDAPVQFTSFLRPLPYKLGCLSRYSVVETPHGLVWLASDKTIQIYNGEGPPQTLSRNINPVLRLITAGTESTIRATFFNYLERDWYVLACAINGSTINNQIIIVDLEENPESNAGIFRSDIEADEISVVEDINGQSLLITISQGVINQFVTASDTFYGYSQPQTSTSGTLNAYWRSGLFGNANPQMFKMFRWATVVRDPNMSEFYIQPAIVGEDNNFQFPRLLTRQRLSDDGRFALGPSPKGRRAYLEVQFPKTDESANLIEMSCTHIPLAER